MPQIHWYPGHMARAKRLMQEDIKRVDVVVLVSDARAPRATHNPDIERIAAEKAIVRVLAKADLARESETQRWLAFYRRLGQNAVAIDARSNASKQVIAQIEAAAAPKVERDLQRGIRRTVRAMVAGIPNCGKSTLINGLARGAKAKTGDRPGVTRAGQWIRVHEHLELLDTPGLLWPRQDERRTALHLAWIAAIRAEILDPIELATHLLDELRSLAPQGLMERYGLEQELLENPQLGERDIVEDEGSSVNTQGLALLEPICRRRGCLVSGGELDYERGAQIVLEDFRAQRLGRITLEKAP